MLQPIQLSEMTGKLTVMENTKTYQKQKPKKLLPALSETRRLPDVQVGTNV